MAKSKLVPVLASVTAVLITGIFTWQMCLSLQFFNTINDLPEYYVAAKLALSGKGALIYKAQEFYAAQEQFFPGGGHGVLLFILPPGILWLLPLAAIPASMAPTAWTALLQITLMLTIILFARFFRLKYLDTLLLWCFTFFSGPAIDGVRIGQIAPFLLLALCGLLSALNSSNAVVAGISLAFFMLKPQQIFPFAIFLLGAGRYRILLIAAVIAAAFAVGSYFLIGSEGYQNYLQLVNDPASLKIMQPELNPTIRGQLCRILGVENKIVSVVSGICYTLIAGFVFFLGRTTNMASKTIEKDSDKKAPSESSSNNSDTDNSSKSTKFGDSTDPNLRNNWIQTILLGVMPIGLVCSIHCHYYDLLLLIPSIVVTLQIASSEKKVLALKALAVLVGGALLFPVYSPIRYQYLMRGGMIDPIFLIILSYSIAAFLYTFSLTTKKVNQA